MGTWGTGPFSSDGALDLLDELAGLDQEGRVAELGRIFSTVNGDSDRLMKEVFPDEVMASVALVAISLPGGAGIADAQREAVRDELLAAILTSPAFELVQPALNALQSIAGPDGLWLRGWTSEDKRTSAIETVTQLQSVLESATEND